MPNDEMTQLIVPAADADTQSTGPGQQARAWQPLLWRAGKRKRFFPKQVMYRQGDPVDCVCLVRRGLVKLRSYLPNGRARIVRLHCAGHFMGLEGLLGMSYEHTAIAVGEVEVDHFLISALHRFYRENPMANEHFLSQWHGDRSQADKWILDFSTGEIKPRVARLITYLSQLDFSRNKGKVELLTVDEMAEILGVTPESVSHHLADFKRNNILHKQPDPTRDLYRLDSEKLRQVAMT